MSPSGCSIVVARSEAVVWVRVSGRATFHDSLALEVYLRSCADPHPPRQVHVDLAHCVFMDSTFIGTLLRVGARRMFRTSVTCQLVCPSPECLALIRTMHLDQVLTVVDQGGDPPGPTAPLPPVPLDQQALGRHALKAHQHLADVDDDNARLFGPIVEQLREELEGDAPGADPGRGHP